MSTSPGGFMTKPRSIFTLFVLCVCFRLVAAQPVSLAPAEVALNAFGSATLTVTLGQPAPLGGTTLSIVATPVSFLQVPAVIVIPMGGTIATFIATAVVASGSGFVEVSDGKGFSATAVVTVGDVIPAQCAAAIDEAKLAAQTYLSGLEPLREACVRPGDECSALVSAAAAEQRRLAKLQRGIRISCTRTRG
jgi:hypothetical protein